MLVLAASFFACSDDSVDTPEYSAELEAEQLDTLLEDLIANDVDVDTTEQGMYYVLGEAGEGEFPLPDDSISVRYVGYFLNGGVFDSSLQNEGQVFNYRHLTTSMIPGFEEAVGMLQEGGSGSFIMPSALAYGPNGYYIIPPYTPLIFDIELVDIISEETE